MDAIESRRKYAKGLEVQERIVSAALQRFAELGYGGCSIMDLAAAAQVSKNQLFHHFGNKENIALACVERIRRDWRNDVATPAQIYPDPAAQLDFVLTHFSERLESGWPGLRALASLAPATKGVPKAISDAVAGVLDEMQNWLRGIIKDARRTGQITSGMKARPLADYFVATLLGAAVLNAVGDGERGVGVVSALRSQLLGNQGTKSAATTGQ